MILLIGYGNLLCGDDGIGPYVVERLANPDAQSCDDIQYFAVRQLTPELAEPISRADVVIFVDASCAGIVGEIVCRELEVASATAVGAFTHHFDASRLLESAQSLYGRHPAAYLYTVSGQSFKLGDSFSPAVELVLPVLFTQLKARIAQCMNSVLQKQ